MAFSVRLLNRRSPGLAERVGIEAMIVVIRDTHCAKPELLALALAFLIRMRPGVCEERRRE